jgi:hypothetical protein
MDDKLAMEGRVLQDPPNEYLEQFSASVEIIERLDKLDSISIKNLALRSCRLKNTDFIIGIATYIGHDTKIFQNSKR